MPEIRLPAPELFELDQGTTYLNSAYMGPLPRASLEVAHRAAALKARPWRIGIEDFFAPLEQARRAFAALVGGDADGVALIPAVSYGMATAAQNLRLGAGQRVLLLSEQFPSAVYAFAKAAARAQAELCFVPRPSDDDWTAAVLEAIDERVGIVCLPHCHWTDGARLDLVQIGQAARSVGAALVVDACQSLGAMPFDVAAIRPDFVISAAYKWLLGPYSLGAMWVAPAHRAGEPIENGWMAREGSEDFASLVRYREAYQAGARRFDVGEPSNFALLPVAVRSMTLIDEIGVEAIADHGKQLTDQIAARAEALGLGTVDARHRSPHLTGIRLAGADTQRLVDTLQREQVYVSVRGASVRISAHLYNTSEDVERLFAAVELGLR